MRALVPFGVQLSSSGYHRRAAQSAHVGCNDPQDKFPTIQHPSRRLVYQTRYRHFAGTLPARLRLQLTLLSCTQGQATLDHANSVLELHEGHGWLHEPLLSSTAPAGVLHKPRSLIPPLQSSLEGPSAGQTHFESQKKSVLRAPQHDVAIIAGKAQIARVAVSRQKRPRRASMAWNVFSARP